MTFEPGALSWGLKGNILHNLPQALLFASIMVWSHPVIRFTSSNIHVHSHASSLESSPGIEEQGCPLSFCNPFVIVR